MHPDSARCQSQELAAPTVFITATRCSSSWQRHETAVANAHMPEAAPRILYCHCQYAQVVPKDVKDAVLKKLCESGAAFEAVADLCEMAARRDPALQRLASGGAVKIAACFPRAVKGLFHQTGADLSPQATEILNMRTLSTDEIVGRLFSEDTKPNLPGRGDARTANERDAAV